MTSPQTLVPEIRFEGFSSAWERHRLSEFANFSRGNGLSWADVQSDGVNECILYGNLYTDYGMIAESVKYRTNLVPSNPAFSQYGDVLIPGSDTTPTGLARATSIEKTGVLLGGDINILRPNGNVNGSCLSLAINANKSELIKLIKGITVRHIHNDDIKDVEVAFPVAKDEQEKLVGVFKKIDYLINLHQRKQNHLKSVKKSMLEKMFPRDGANVPEIRFAGFTNAWEQRKLSCVVDRITRKNTNLESTLPLTISAQYGLVDQVTYFNNRVASQNISNYYLVKNGEFAYNKSSSDGYPFGTVKRLDLYDMGVLSTLYIVFAIKDQNVNSDFLACYYDTDNWYKQVSERAAEGARNHGLLNISADDFLDTDLMIPPDIQEQALIGEYLKKLDDIITLHQCKCDKLKEIKNSLLQKMFV